jgi:hypothetical protein
MATAAEGCRWVGRSRKAGGPAGPGASGEGRSGFATWGRSPIGRLAAIVAGGGLRRGAPSDVQGDVPVACHGAPMVGVPRSASAEAEPDCRGRSARARTLLPALHGIFSLVRRRRGNVWAQSAEGRGPYGPPAERRRADCAETVFSRIRRCCKVARSHDSLATTPRAQAVSDLCPSRRRAESSSQHADVLVTAVPVIASVHPRNEKPRATSPR